MKTFEKKILNEKIKKNSLTTKSLLRIQKSTKVLKKSFKQDNSDERNISMMSKVSLKATNLTTDLTIEKSNCQSPRNFNGNNDLDVQKDFLDFFENFSDVLKFGKNNYNEIFFQKNKKNDKFQNFEEKSDLIEKLSKKFYNQNNLFKESFITLNNDNDCLNQLNIDKVDDSQNNIENSSDRRKFVYQKFLNICQQNLKQITDLVQISKASQPNNEPEIKIKENNTNTNSNTNNNSNNPVNIPNMVNFNINFNISDIKINHINNINNDSNNDKPKNVKSNLPRRSIRKTVRDPLLASRLKRIKVKNIKFTNITESSKNNDDSKLNKNSLNSNKHEHNNYTYGGYESPRLHLDTDEDVSPVILPSSIISSVGKPSLEINFKFSSLESKNPFSLDNLTPLPNLTNIEMDHDCTLTQSQLFDIILKENPLNSTRNSFRTTKYLDLKPILDHLRYFLFHFLEIVKKSLLKLKQNITNQEIMLSRIKKKFK